MPHLTSAEVRANYPHPGDDPIARLRHTIDIFVSDVRGDDFAIIATEGVYPDGEHTGLTWDDLRAIAERLGA